jgi:hypothetical protein
MGLDGALASYLGVARAVPFQDERAKSAAAALLDEANRAPVEQCERALASLADDVSRDAESLLLSAVMAGALIERGVPGDAFGAVLFPRLSEWLQASVVLLNELLGDPASHPDPGSEADDENCDWVGTRLSDEHPWALVGDTYSAAVAFLGQSPRARREQRVLLPALQRLEPYHPGAAWLRQMLDVLDDEPLVVLDVAAQRGCQGTLSGVASNFELFVLVADAATGAPSGGGLALAPPPALAVRCLSGEGPQDSGIVVEAGFNAYQYSALGPDGALPDARDFAGSAHWIWGEGEPWEIPALDGVRVVLVGPPSYARLIPAQRTFASLRASVRLTPLSPAEVDTWLARIVRANAN